MTRTRLSRAAVLLGSLALAAVAFGYVPDGPPDRPDRPNAKPATKPSKPHVHDDGNLLVDATTKPTTKPSTKPTARISPDAQPVLDKVVAAYKALNSGRFAGTITSDLDLNGQQRKDRGEFESLLLAPNRGPTTAPAAIKFRHSTREVREAMARQDTIVGSTGEKLYVFDPNRNYFVSEDAPKGRTNGSTLGKPYRDLLEMQDPALLMALSDDPAAALLDGVEAVEKVDDEKINDVAHPALKMTSKTGEEVVVLIDPKTNLLRRLTFDLRKPLEKRGQKDVKTATITIDYADVSTDAPAALKEQAYAWAPPAGARDVSSMAGAIASGDSDDENYPAMALEGKAAPDFKLTGLDGKPVSMADLKDSVVVLDFWATWCGPCRMSLPGLQKVYEAGKESGLHVFAVNLREDEDDVKAFVKETKLLVPILMDTDGKVAEKYLVQPIPQTVVIGKDGVVKKVFIGAGPDTHEKLKQAVEEAGK
jgi:cytochrome c biogenesis protein CcmG, thiol:disulfide interchange protein DsbE